MYTKKIQVTCEIFHGIPFKSVAKLVCTCISFLILLYCVVQQDSTLMTASCTKGAATMHVQGGTKTEGCEGGRLQPHVGQIVPNC